MKKNILLAETKIIGCVLCGLVFLTFSCKNEVVDYRQDRSNWSQDANTEKATTGADVKPRDQNEQSKAKCAPDKMVNGSCPSDKKTPSQPSSSSTVPTTQTPTDSSSEVDDDSIDNKLPDLGTGTFKRPTLLHSGVREFYIRAGIGSQSWNTRDETIEMQVGQTLRVINQDAIAHSLFLPGLDGRSIVIEPGKSHDYTLDSPIEPGTNPPTYDQSTGENAKFWLRVRP